MQKIHYRVLRSTVVLAMSSAAIRQVMTPELQRAVDEAKRRNYQFDQIAPELLDHLYASFDADFTRRVREEFTFFPRVGSVRVHGTPVGVCELCGKGDSKETGDNRDHLCIEYLLTNTAGGTDKWCGSTCIVNFGLKVDGAATAEEAARLLGRTMRQAVRQFEINAWRAENGDHASIQSQYESVRSLVSYVESTVRSYRGELILCGFDAPVLLGARRIQGDLKRAAAFYLREGWLTPAKMTAWVEGKQLLREVRKVKDVLAAGMNMQGAGARFEYFLGFNNKDVEVGNGEAA